MRKQLKDQTGKVSAVKEKVTSLRQDVLTSVMLGTRLAAICMISTRISVIICATCNGVHIFPARLLEES